MSGRLVYHLPIAIKRVSVTRTSQLVVVHVELCERSHLAELGWDATCEANRPVSEGDRVVCHRLVFHLQSSEFEPRSRTRKLVRAQVEHYERSQLPEHGWNATCETNSLP